MAQSNWSSFVADGRGLIDPQEMPGSLAINGTRDLKPFFYGGFWNVAASVRALIEDLDPARHQFVPLNVTNWHDQPIDAGEWFLMNVHFRQASVIDELSNVKAVRGYENTHEKMLINYLSPSVTVDPEKLLPDAHLWREDRYLRALFISDEFYGRLAELGVELPCHQLRLRDVDQPSGGKAMLPGR